jgi:hypothetical protein
LAHDGTVDEVVRRARALALRGEDEAAKQIYLEALRIDPACFEALNDLGALAYSSGHRSAARTAYRQAVDTHPANPIGRVNLANILAEDGDPWAAQLQFEAALALDPDLPQAHQGLARVLDELGDERAERHRQQGFAGRSIEQRRYRGEGRGVPLLLLATARLGNMPTRLWIDDGAFAISIVHVEYWRPSETLPPHALIVNAVGDADLCGAALTRAQNLLAHSSAPVVNLPARVAATGRAENARRLADIPGVVTPKVETLARGEISAIERGAFPFLLRAPGFHTGLHFERVESGEDLAGALGRLPGESVMAIEYLDARGPDGLARKYRVMCVDGRLFPLHLAISADWKVHYFTADMAAHAARRDEERRFLEDMPATLGARAMSALHGVFARIGLDYAGIDFALRPDGSLLLFEANATMVVIPPPPDPIWDYRRRAVADVVEAARRMIRARAGIVDEG